MSTQETDLFGVPVAPEAPREDKGPPVNDMRVVHEVLRAASSAGFVLVGRGERVHRRTTGSEVEQVSAVWDRAVHQLIAARWLEIGGTHQVRYGRYQGPARSVLVPKKTRNATHRWTALSPFPHQRGKEVA